ncbi:MAG: hypothetical protein ACRDK2_06135 [Solirubrobacteraceae bacterium]
MRYRISTAPIAAGSMIAGYAVSVGSGSRALGGLVLAIGGLWCIWVWGNQHGYKRAAALGMVGLTMLVVSHLLALAIGAWPAVLVSAGVVALVAWYYADAPWSVSDSAAGRIDPL